MATKVLLPIIDGTGATKFVTADADDSGALILYSIPAVGGDPVSLDNPLPVVAAPSEAEPSDSSVVVVGGTPVVVFGFATIGSGGAFIVNPFSATEDLFVDPTSPPGLAEGGTTSRLRPGQSYALPPLLSGAVYANAASSGHAFAAVRF